MLLGPAELRHVARAPVDCRRDRGILARTAVAGCEAVLGPGTDDSIRGNPQRLHVRQGDRARNLDKGVRCAGVKPCLDAVIEAERDTCVATEPASRQDAPPEDGVDPVRGCVMPSRPHRMLRWSIRPLHGVFGVVANELRRVHA